MLEAVGAIRRGLATAGSQAVHQSRVAGGLGGSQGDEWLGWLDVYSWGTRGRCGSCGGGGGEGGILFCGGIGWTGLEVYDAVLAPLVLLHGFFPVELLVADVALEGSIVSMSPFMDL